LAKKLSKLAKDVERLEVLVADLLRERGAVPAPILVEIQNVDRLRQSLEDMARIARASTVIVHSPDQLSAQLHMLESGHVFRTESRRAASGPNTGDVDLF